MQNVKFVSISAGIGFVLSLFCGFFSHSAFSRIFLIAFLFACIFGILGLLISFVYNKFLNLDATGDDVGYTMAASLAGGSKNSVNHKVDIVISEEDLEQTGNNNHYEVGSNRQMLYESDYQNNLNKESESEKEFVPLRTLETVTNFSGTEAIKPGAAASFSDKPLSGKGNAGFSVINMDKNISNAQNLPDMNEITFSNDLPQGDEENSGVSNNDSELLSENSDFISSALNYKEDSNGIKDASLMAKAISSILSEET